MKYNQELPKEVEEKLDAYIERIKAIKWFQPKVDLKKEEVDKQINISLEAVGVKAGIEYRKLQIPKDWDAARGAARGVAWGATWDAAWDAACGVAWDVAWGAARDAARDAAWDAAWDVAWGAARDAARDAAWDAARDAARDAAWDAAWDVAWGAARDAACGVADLLALNLEEYKKKYPNGNFINLIPLWEMGLYPCGVIDGKFVIYIPASKMEFPKELV